MTMIDELKADLLQDRTITQVAKQLGVHRVNLSLVLNGKAALTVNMAMRLQLMFGFDARDLLHRQLDEELEAAGYTMPENEVA